MTDGQTCDGQTSRFLHYRTVHRYAVTIPHHERGQPTADVVVMKGVREFSPRVGYLLSGCWSGELVVGLSILMYALCMYRGGRGGRGG